MENQKFGGSLTTPYTQNDSVSKEESQIVPAAPAPGLRFGGSLTTYYVEATPDAVVVSDPLIIETPTDVVDIEHPVIEIDTDDVVQVNSDEKCVEMDNEPFPHRQDFFNNKNKKRR